MNEDGENREGTPGEENPGEQKEGEEIAASPKEEERRLNTKSIPAVVMLLAGAATSIMAFIRGMDLTRSLELILGSLVLFLILGEIAKALLDRIVIKTVIEQPTPDRVIEINPEEPGEDIKSGNQTGNNAG